MSNQKSHKTHYNTSQVHTNQSPTPTTPQRVLPPNFRTIYRRRLLFMKIAQTLATVSDLETLAEQDEVLLKLNLNNTEFTPVQWLSELSMVDLCLVDCALQRICPNALPNRKPHTQADGDRYLFCEGNLEWFYANERQWEEFEWAFFCNAEDMYEQMETIVQTTGCARAQYLPHIIACGLLWEGATLATTPELNWTDINFVEGSIPNEHGFTIELSDRLLDYLREAQGVRFAQPVKGASRSPHILSDVHTDQYTNAYDNGDTDMDALTYMIYKFWKSECGKLPHGHIYAHKRFVPLNIVENGKMYRNLNKETPAKYYRDIYDAASTEFVDRQVRDRWRAYYYRQEQLFWLLEEGLPVK